MIWTSAMEDDLRARFADGQSYGAIGRAMGVSRNAALGKSHRLGLERHGASAVLGGPSTRPRSGSRLSHVVKAAPVAEPTPRRPLQAPPVKATLNAVTVSAANSIRHAAEGGGRNVRPAQPVVPPGHPAFAPLPGVTPLPLDALGGRRCCWPVGDAAGEGQLYCAAPADLPPHGTTRSPYCDHHLAARQSASAPRRRTAA